MTDEITLADKIAFIERAITYWRRAGEEGDDYAESTRVLKAICADLRAMTEETAHTAHRALAHQVQAAKRQRARIGYIDAAVERALAHTVVAHWPAVQQALRDAARHEELRLTIEAQRDMISELEESLAVKP